MKLRTDRSVARRDGATGWIQFKQPQRHNAVLLEMWGGLHEALDAFAQDPEVRVGLGGGHLRIRGQALQQTDHRGLDARALAVIEAGAWAPAWRSRCAATCASLPEVVARCFASEDYVEGRRAFMEKRKPRFQGR